jgi:hypothetical protein
MQTTMKLEDPIYFNQRAWIALMKEVSINNLQTMLFYVSEQQRRQRA